MPKLGDEFYEIYTQVKAARSSIDKYGDWFESFRNGA